jgi:hypothetical protein
LAEVTCAVCASVQPRSAARVCAMRGSSAGVLRLRQAGGAFGRGAVQPVRRDVGRVGLQHQRRVGQRRRQRRICSARSKVSAPPKPSLKPPFDELPGLHGAAVEGMRDAAATGTRRSPASNASAERRTCRITGSPASRASLSWAM